MSSPMSHLAELRRGLPEAVADVAENSLFAFADSSDEATFLEASSGLPADWVHASVGFAGSASGRLELSAPAAVVSRLCAAFSGEMTPEVSDAALVDFAGELTNMVCGTWLTRAWGDLLFALTPPQVVRGGVAPPGSATASPEGMLYMSIDDAPVRLQIVEEAGSAE